MLISPVRPSDFRRLCSTKSEPLERISAQSSDDAGGSGSVLDEVTGSLADERQRLEKKMAKVREKITWNTISREGDVEEYLRITNGVDNVADNPQLARIRQHFEKKNKKYSQEAEQLQKKLDELERKLEELNNGVDLNRSGHHRMLHNVGHGIKRTGVNLKEMTGTVINAPLDIAQKVKRNVFGSADNIPAVVQESSGASNVGQSIFYENGHLYTNPTSSHCESEPVDQEVPPQRPETEPEMLTKLSHVDDGPDRPELTYKLQKDLNSVRESHLTLQTQYETLKKLEQSLNETMDLHQNEVKQLKNDLTLIGTRMDYQYNDRFKKIEESIESAQNRMYRMETNWHENSERLLGAGQNMWNAVMLSFANIVVEVLKIILYFIAVVLDSVKPFTGTRKRAGFVVFGSALLFILWSMIGYRMLSVFHSSPARHSTQP